MKAFITGINGQDGSYLAEILLSNGWDVYGLIRRSSTSNTERIDKIVSPESKGIIFYGDMADGIDNILYDIQPDVVFNLASMSHVKISFDIPVYTGDITGIGVTRILEGIRKICPATKFYQASSSEMFGITPPAQNELSSFQPVSPYGCAKLYGYHITRTYRMGYNIFASNGILFNHESPRRGINFVTRKITRAAARIKLGMQTNIRLGNLDAERDFGHARDYMNAVYMIMQHDTPDDFVVATGEKHTIREFAELVFKSLGLDFFKHLIEDDSYKRPNEVPALCGDSEKIRTILGWKPLYSFKELVEEMIANDLAEERKLCKK